MKNFYVYLLALMITIIILASVICTYKNLNNSFNGTNHCENEMFWEELITLEEVM